MERSSGELGAILLASRIDSTAQCMLLSTAASPAIHTPAWDPHPPPLSPNSSTPVPALPWRVVSTPPPSSPTLWLHSIRQELEDKERRLRENILLNYHRIKDVERELSDLQVRHGLLCFDVLLALLLLLLQ